MVIDHHVSQDDLGAIFLKDTSAEATGMLVMSAVAALGGTLTSEVATGLFTAIAMDTGWFRHTNTRPRTLRAAAELMESGAEIDRDLPRPLRAEHPGPAPADGGNAVRTEDRAGWPHRLCHDLAGRPGRTGAIPPDSEDLVDFTVSLRGVEVGVLFIEQARGGVQGVVPVEERPRLRPAGRNARRGRSPGGGGCHAAGRHGGKRGPGPGHGPPGT